MTPSTVLASWEWDTSSAVLIVLVSTAYWWASRRSRIPVKRWRPWCFGVGVVLWVLATMSPIGVYAAVLFWVRAVQVLSLLLVVPFFLAMAQPLTVLRGALAATGQRRFDRLLASPAARVIAHPLTTSMAMLATPWLLYLTPWYVAALEQSAVAAVTRIWLLLTGFGYFYARIQADPVPRRYSQLVSFVISIVETIGDGLLGIVLWLGPLIAVDYYTALHREWGPSLRTDQSIGAGILWLLGDVLGVPFLIVLLRAFSADEKVRAVEVDAELDRDEESQPEPGLWWETDPQLRDRFGRR